MAVAPARNTSEAEGGRYQPLVVVLTAVAAGIVADRYLALPLWLLASIGAASLVVWHRLWTGGRERIATIVILLAVATLGAAWHHLCWRVFAHDEIGRFATRDAQPVCLEVVAISRPRARPPPPASAMRSYAPETITQFDVAARAIRDGPTWQTCSGRVRVSVSDQPSAIEPGDRLRIVGLFAKIDGPQNPGEFDFADYARGERRFVRLRTDAADCLTLIERGKPLAPLRWLAALRNAMARRIHTGVGDHLAPLATAMLVGQREDMDQDLNEAFLVTGTVHLLSVSGLHVAILATAFGGVLSWLPLRRGLAGLLLGSMIVGYAMLVDAQPPVVRASVLVVSWIVAGALYRRRSGFNALALAGLVVLAINPADLFRTGTQLSFLCVAALVASVKLWQPRRPSDPLARLIAGTEPWPDRLWRHTRGAMHSMFIGSAVIWAITLPLVVARFHVVSLTSLALNPLMSLPVALAMNGGALWLLIGWLTPLGELSRLACLAGFSAIEAMVRLGAAVPHGHLWLPGPPDWWLAGFYGMLGAWTAFAQRRLPWRWCFALMGLWTTVGFAVSWQARQRDELVCTFLSVGHGCAVLIECPSGQNVLYDAGRLGSPEGAARSIAAALWSKGISHLDAVILSHADTDHYDALPELLKRFSVGVVYVSPVMFADRMMWEGATAAWEAENAALDELQAAIRRAGVPMRVISAGQRLSPGPGCSLEVLHPPSGGVLGGDNVNSLVVSVDYQGRCVLLPGDLEKAGLGDLLAELPRDCDVLLAPHHGSRNSCPASLAAWATPEWVVISGSRRWDTESVESIYRDRGCQVMSTADRGAIRAALSAEGVCVSHFVEPTADGYQDRRLGTHGQ